MTIDTSKIKPGDTGTVRVTFGQLNSHATRIEVHVSDMAHSYYVSARAIASHTPAPWVPEKGDVVKWNESGKEFEVLAVAGRFAWVAPVGGIEGNFPCAQSSLRLIRKGAA